MPADSPIYTLDNCHAAYQLDWSLSIFWHEEPSAAEWLGALQAATEPDGVRVLEHRFLEERMSQFLVSTKPTVSPHALVRSVKGRLQYLIRGERPKAFQRNLAYQDGMKREFEFGYYAGTFGEYDLGAIPRA